MRRLIHRLFPSRHTFQPYELMEEGRPTTLSDGTRGPDPNPHAAKVWYVGYRCRCGESGFMVPIDVD